ncbi:MAG: hypothetical protein QG629_587 [Patescibacteria group bacterium]|nr:hypothetical protein [Candidatus Saccharibacteria bacterium]MDQ5963505.1 hypothetical protein [Patescibacteria group bacterium]
MLFGRQDSDDNAQTKTDGAQSDYLSAIGTDGQPANQSTQNPALPPDNSIFKPSEPSGTPNPVTPESSDETSTTTGVITSALAVEGQGSTQSTTEETATTHPEQDSPAQSEDDTTPSLGAITSDASTAPLSDLKQEAIDHLTPLVSHLDQTPEEKFRTTMMMIQSTDNHELIKDAFAAAKEIQDDKIRAQALLDVINEINYFTQKKS